MIKLHCSMAATCFVAMSLGALAQESRPSPLDRFIDEPTLAAPLRFLADDLLEGRGVGSRGDLLARAYLATQFQLLGLSPGGPNGSWVQPVPIVAITSAIATPLEAAGSAGKAAFSAPGDYVAWAHRPDDRTEWKDAEVVFVGYGIRAPEQQWDDYKGADLKGKVLLF